MPRVQHGPWTGSATVVPSGEFDESVLETRMRRSDLFLPASRERRGQGTEAAELLVRAGLIREFGSGLWGLTPAGKRVQENVVRRIRTGMHSVGGQEVTLPGLQQRERWEESGRWQSFEGEMFTLADRDGRELCLAPSHEEGMVHLLDGLVRSYEELPLTLYQVDSKFRDDHARAGLLHGEGQSVGERFAESELLGIPAKIVLGNGYRETGQAEIETQDGESRQVAVEEVATALERFRAGG